jgi:hypothetical protein
MNLEPAIGYASKDANGHAARFAGASIERSR